ncbi:MAG: IS21 family transposase [Deltaproteobacteria bacterium]|nr:IS21 family transposase [Deltaproteobacteria bacterium]
MISYPMYCQLRQLHRERGLHAGQIASETGLDEKTVAKWLAAEKYAPRPRKRRVSQLDRWRSEVARLLESHAYSAVQILQRLRQQGYTGGYTAVKDLVRQLRPPAPAAFLTLAFAPGECAQVDWGAWGSVTVGSTRRQLSFFVMVLCYSRMLYVEFTLSQTLEHFLACHQHAFEYFGAVPLAVMIDNAKTAVLERPLLGAPVFNPRYLDFARHYGFEIKACGVRKPHEKGRVENAVGYVQKGFLRGLATDPYSALNPAVRHWLETVANLRIHGQTQQRPLDL